ncbi:contact-dependent growth inhibition system immunity protein [Actinomycetospora sp. OC33-EN08]|uniref:Contact-dependent growth inhibition system immunity protein n=1 Tax=Actinomycetospora aurantiaca TaxID=3129233 RepID=A0ABU8MK11_9PSEU
MTNTEPAYETLSNFFGCYLNQNCPDDYGSATAAIEAYKREFPPKSLVATSEDASALVHLHLEEDELRVKLLGLGLEYTPWTDGWTARRWLVWLANDLVPTSYG